jgi:hypothetical protein
LGHLGEKVLAEKTPEAGIIKKRVNAARDGALGVNSHHGWSYPIHCCRYKTATGSRVSYRLPLCQQGRYL